MPTETNSPKPAVQVPAQTPVESAKTPLPDAPKPVPATPAPKSAGIVQEPGKDYDLHRGVGGDYVIDEKTGHRVPARKK